MTKMLLFVALGAHAGGGFAAEEGLALDAHG
jgi:hypothetical protein